MSNKVKRKTPLKKTKLAKTFDYEEKLGIPNPYDKGKFGVKGNKKLLNVKTRKKYEKVKDLLRVLDLEADLGKKEKFDKGGSKKNKKEEISKKIDKMMGFPMEKIDELIKQAKDLNKPKKRFDKGGSNMAKKNFSSKELIMKATQPKKSKKKLADVSKEDMIKAGFSSFGKESLRKYLNMKNKLGRKPRADDFRKTIKAKDKNPELKKSKSLVGIAGKQFTPKKTPRKTIKAKDKNPELENKSLVGIAGKQFTPVKPKKELSIAAKQYSPKINKMNKGGVFKGIF